MRHNADQAGLRLIRAGSAEGQGMSTLLRAYALRILGGLGHCDEKTEFLLAVLETAERERFLKGLSAFAEKAGHPVDEDDLPSTRESDDLTHFSSYLGKRLGRVVVERKVQSLLKGFLAGKGDDGRCPVAPPEAMVGPVLEFAKIFSLNIPECSVLIFYHALAQSTELNALFERLAVQARPQFISLCSGLPEADVVEALGASGALLRCGLLMRDDEAPLPEAAVSSMVTDGLSGISGSLSHERFCAKASEARFAPEDFGMEHVALDIMSALLRSDAPCAILLYGSPGTGKTEFARSLAASCGKEAWFLGEGRSGSVKDRQSILPLCAASLAGSGKILIVDEADALLSSGRGLFFRPGAMSKSWINGFLDGAKGKSVWIVNNTEDIDPSALRRFSYACRFERFSPAERLRIWRRCSADAGLALDEAAMSRLAAGYQVDAAGIARAVELGATMRAADPQASVQAAIAASLESQLLLSTGDKPARPRSAALPYDPGAIDADIPASDILAALESWKAQRASGGSRGLRMLFWGRPGTGKSELCRKMVEKAGLTLVEKRASDLLDKYVGESEKRIAAAFCEAERQGAVLLIDEADSFLCERSQAQHSWELSQVNEFLARMESYEGVLVCTTNLMERLDAASLRRFQLKVEFRPPAAASLLGLLASAFPSILPPTDALEALRGFEGIATPGDLAALAERLAWRGLDPRWEELLAELEMECGRRKPRRSIGFGG